MIQSIERACAILALLAEEPERPVFLAEIAGRLRLKPGTCANILKTLAALDYVEQTAARKGYILGPQPYRLARNGAYRKDLVQAAEPHLRALAVKTRETVLLATLRNGSRIILSQVSGNAVFQVRDRYLREENLYTTATGRLLLAYAADKDLSLILNQKGLPTRAQWPEAATEKTFQAERARIRKTGWALVQGEAAGVGFPIREKGRVAASLGLFMPGFRLTPARKTIILKDLAAAAKTIDSTLQGAPP